MGKGDGGEGNAGADPPPVVNRVLHGTREGVVRCLPTSWVWAGHDAEAAKPRIRGTYRCEQAMSIVADLDSERKINRCRGKRA